MTSREQQYLLDILIAAEDAMSFVQTATFEQFKESSLLRSAVLHCLTVIGEAAGRIGNASEADVPDLAWRRMKNLRNVIVHDYESVNLPLIWKILNEELPAVVSVLDPLFPDRPKQ